MSDNELSPPALALVESRVETTPAQTPAVGVSADEEQPPGKQIKPTKVGFVLLRHSPPPTSISHSGLLSSTTGIANINRE